MAMNAVSLFSGIGGIDIGLSAAGFDVIAQVEIDEYCQQVLRKHRRQWWPNSVIHDDARKFGVESIGYHAVDILAGGFPCQPFSTAGVQRGADDPRNMWPETRRIIGEIQPRVVLLENVAGLITRTGDTPGYVGTVLADLSEMGYVGAWGVISAADAGAPHRRERVWIVGYSEPDRRHSGSGYRGERQVQADIQRNLAQVQPAGQRHESVLRAYGAGTTLANAAKSRLQKPITSRHPAHGKKVRTGMDNRSIGRGGMGHTTSQRRTRYGASRQQVAATRPGTRLSARPDDGQAEPRMGRATHGIPRWLDRPQYPAPQGNYQHAWEAPRTVDQSQQYRRQRIQALGNAVVPQIVYYIAKEIYQTLEDNS